MRLSTLTMNDGDDERSEGAWGVVCIRTRLGEHSLTF